MTPRCPTPQAPAGGSAPSYSVRIFIAGDHATALELCQQYCDVVGLCVTVEPCAYVYTGGQEPGVVVGLINYPRFPKSPEALRKRAVHLACYLRHHLGQQSFSVQTPETTEWHSWRGGV